MSAAFEVVKPSKQTNFRPFEILAFRFEDVDFITLGLS